MALLAATSANVDCKRIMDELQAARTAQDVRDSLAAIPESDIKFCRQQADREAAAARARGENVPDGSTALPEGSKGR
jgi:hypothetical protein